MPAAVGGSRFDPITLALLVFMAVLLGGGG